MKALSLKNKFCVYSGPCFCDWTKEPEVFALIGQDLTAAQVKTYTPKRGYVLVVRRGND